MTRRMATKKMGRRMPERQRRSFPKFGLAHFIF
jgi:hypothetical protein